MFLVSLEMGGGCFSIPLMHNYCLRFPTPCTVFPASHIVFPFPHIIVFPTSLDRISYPNDMFQKALHIIEYSTIFWLERQAFLSTNFAPELGFAILSCLLCVWKGIFNKRRLFQFNASICSRTNVHNDVFLSHLFI